VGRIGRNVSHHCVPQKGEREIFLRLRCFLLMFWIGNKAKRCQTCTNGRHNTCPPVPAAAADAVKRFLGARNQRRAETINQKVRLFV
jgi:hypothetical protein